MGWPLSSDSDDRDRSVTIRIDSIKDLETTAIMHPPAGQGFILHKQSKQDGMVKLLEIENFKQLDSSTHEVLIFNRSTPTLDARRNLLRRGSKESLLNNTWMRLTRLDCDSPNSKDGHEQG